MLFSILVPVYNDDRYLAAAIDSALGQDFRDFEIIVIDDGSNNPATSRILSSYGNRIRVLRQENAGPEIARRNAVPLAAGEYLVSLDADDVLYPHALATYKEVIDRFNRPPLLIGARKPFEGEDVPVEKSCAPRILKYQDLLSKEVDVGTSMSMIVVRKDTFYEVGAEKNCTPASWHLNDIHLFLKVGTQHPCIVVEKPSIVAYRYHDTNCHKNQNAMVEAILSLVAMEKSGIFPGGTQRRDDRYRWIGVVAWYWVRRLLKCGDRKLAMRLLFNAAPMIPAGMADWWQKRH